MKTDLKEREEIAIEAALRGKPILDFLLPFSKITIDRACHEDFNKNVGKILDRMSSNYYEWYGYSLAEKRDMSLIVDTLIQLGQFVTGDDVDFQAKEASKALEELYQRNLNEKRAGTDRELIMVGIVHRHGFCAGMPIRSEHKDIKNLSDYLHWKATETERLSPHKTDFDNIGKFKVQVNGDSLILVPESIDGIIIEYPLGPIEDEIQLLRQHRINPDALKNVGGLRGLLQKHLERQGCFRAKQNRYVSTATSLIYNQDGSQTFGEIALLAKGAVNDSYEHPFVVGVEVVDSGKGIVHSLDEIAKEVDTKISWTKKHATVVSKTQPTRLVRTHEMYNLFGKAAQVWMYHWPSVEIEYGKGKPFRKEAHDFFHTACMYMNAQPKSLYAIYIFGILSKLQSGKTLANAVKAQGILFEDPKNGRREVPRPPFTSLNEDCVVDGMYSGKSLSQLEKGFYQAFTSSTDSSYINRVLEEYIPKFLRGKK